MTKLVNVRISSVRVQKGVLVRIRLWAIKYESKTRAVASRRVVPKVEVMDWSKFWKKINELSEWNKKGFHSRNDPFYCDDCKRQVLINDLMFCVCQDLICQVCKDGENHKNHQTLGEFYKSQGLIK